MADLPHLRIHPNRRFLQTASGEPFFWLGDTAWELFHRLTLDEAVDYLDNRAAKGFNIVQAVAIAELEGLTVPNRNGDLPLRDSDPHQPIDAYFDYIVQVVDLASERGLYIALLPTWADKVNRMWGGGPVIFNPSTAFEYAKYLGARLRGRSNLVWVLGGDRSPEGVEEVWRAMASGLDAGFGEHRIMTYHPYGPHTSGEWLHAEDWLDFNMIQSGHGAICEPTWDMIHNEYMRQPTKPVLDGEPNYEDTPIGFTSRNGYFGPHEVRRQVYRSVFAGGFGVTYGHNSIWQMASNHQPGVIEPLMDWRAALERPASDQMRHLKNLILSRPFFERVPDQSLLLTGAREGAVHARATRCGDASILVYFPQGGLSVEMDLSPLAGKRLAAWSFNPRDGSAISLDPPDSPTWIFKAPVEGPDWVLVIDDADYNFGPPGAI